VPVPSAIREARNPRFKPSAGEPRLRTMAPQCPEHVVADPIAHRAWKHYIHVLRRMKVLTEADRSVVADLSVLQSCYLRAWKQVRELNAAAQHGIGGMIIRTKTDYLAEHMLFSQVKTLTEIKRRLYAEVGLTPSARTRIQTTSTAKGDVNPFAEL